jgi:5-methylcytosine-specific restriction endonuclease McrA
MAERWKSERRRRGSTFERGYGGDHRRRRLLTLHRDTVCRICNAALSTVCDHIIPPAEGGSPTAMSNLQGVCKSCHDKKSGREGRRRVRNVNV